MAIHPPRTREAPKPPKGPGHRRERSDASDMGLLFTAVDPDSRVTTPLHSRCASLVFDGNFSDPSQFASPTQVSVDIEITQQDPSRVQQ